MYCLVLFVDKKTKTHFVKALVFNSYFLFSLDSCSGDMSPIFCLITTLFLPPHFPQGRLDFSISDESQNNLSDCIEIRSVLQKEAWSNFSKGEIPGYSWGWMLFSALPISCWKMLYCCCCTSSSLQWTCSSLTDELSGTFCLIFKAPCSSLKVCSDWIQRTF